MIHTSTRTVEFSSCVYKNLESFFGKFVKTPLTYKKDYELAIAVILSAQCTDERVNQVTPKLFSTFQTLDHFATADLVHIEQLIYSTGFYHNKAKSIQGFARILIEKHSYIIPKTIKELIKLPGIGRKTANVILSEIYSISEGFVVDTHVTRLSRKLHWTQSSNAVKIEKELMSFVPKKLWRNLSLYLIFLGRKFCKANRPDCIHCVLNQLCPSAHISV